MKNRVLSLLMSISLFASLLQPAAIWAATDYAAEVTINGASTPYTTLTQAWNAALSGTAEAPATVKLLKDITQTETLELGKNVCVILDLNDKVLILDGDKDSGISSNNGNLTIVDNAENKTEKYYTRNDDGLWVRSNEVTELKVEGAVITAIENAEMETAVNLLTQACTVSAISFVGCTAMPLYASGDHGEIVISDTDFIGNVNKVDPNAVLTASNKVTVTNCRFEDNLGSEGVLHYSLGSPSKYGALSVSDCTFKNNTSSNGGAVYIGGLSVDETEATIKDCTFTGNKSAEDGGAIYNKCTATIDSCTISENEAVRNGGGIYTSPFAKTLITGCSITGNTAVNGGGIYKEIGTTSDDTTDKMVLVDTSITENSASNSAGGIYYVKQAKVSCFVAGTLVSMADGSTKAVEDIEVGDIVKTFDHETGEFSSSKVYISWKEHTNPNVTFKLNFDGGITLHCVASHTFLEKASRKYRTFTAENAKNYVGQYFFAEDGNWHELKSVSIEEETEWLYEIYTSGHQNSFAGGMLSAPSDVDYLLNIYELDENLKADEQTLKDDIEKYGLLDFDWCSQNCGMSKQWYVDASAKYINIAVGKGLITMDELREIYNSAFEQQEAPKPAALRLSSLQLKTTKSAPSINDYGDSYIGSLVLGKNVVVKDNFVGSDASNIYLHDSSSLIYLDSNHSGINAGVTRCAPGYGQFTANGESADTQLFFSDKERYEVEFETDHLSLVKAPLRITAGSASWVYDGTEHTCTNVTSNAAIVLEAGDILTVTVSGSITDAGTVENKITEYKVMRGDTPVTDEYVAVTTSGALTVTPATVIMTSASASKQYDGTALADSNVDVTGFIPGEGASYNVTGSQTEVGSSKNTFTYTLNSNTKASNYDITTVEGNLTVTAAPAPAPQPSYNNDDPVFTVPVSGDKDTVKVKATVSGTNATVNNVTKEEIETVGTGSNVVIDLSGIKNSVTGVTIPKSTFENVANSDADGLEIRMPNGTIAVFDKTTLAAVASQAKGNNIQLVIDRDEKAEQTMTASQKEAVGGMNNPVVLDAYFVSNGARIPDFNGGEADITAAYPTANPVRVWYVTDDGEKELVPSTFDGKTATFTVTHFSHYVVEQLEASFSDVDKNAYYHDAVLWAAGKGITGGVDETHFCPTWITNRAQMVTFLWRAAGRPKATTKNNPFTDVKEGTYYYDALLWGVENGVVKGTTSTTFSPEETVTRGQAMAFMARFAGVADDAEGYAHSFTDVRQGSYYSNAISWAYTNGITGGKTKTTFAPDEGCQRAHIVVFLYNYFNK